MTNLWLVTFSWTLFPFLLIPFNTWPFLFFRFFWGLVGCPLPFPVNSFSPQRRWPFVLVLHGFWFLVYFIATYLVFICEPSPLSWCHFHLCELRVFFVFCFILISSPLPFPQNSFPFFRSFYSSASVRTFLSPIPRWFYSSPILISLARTDHWWCRILCGRFTGNASSWKERSERGEGRFKQRAVGSDNRRWSTDPVRHAAPTTSIDTFTCVASSCLLPGSAGCDVHYFPIFFSLFPYHFPNVVFLVQQRIPHMDPHLLPPFLRNEMFPLSSVHLPPFKSYVFSTMYAFSYHRFVSSLRNISALSITSRCPCHEWKEFIFIGVPLAPHLRSVLFFPAHLSSSPVYDVARRSISSCSWEEGKRFTQGWIGKWEEGSERRNGVLFLNTVQLDVFSVCFQWMLFILEFFFLQSFIFWLICFFVQRFIDYIKSFWLILVFVRAHHIASYLHSSNVLHFHTTNGHRSDRGICHLKNKKTRTRDMKGMGILSALNALSLS